MHLPRLRVGQGLVGLIAETAEPISTTRRLAHPRLPLPARDRRGGAVELPRRADPAPGRGPRRPGGAEPRAARLHRRRDLRARGGGHGHRRDGRARRLRRPRRHGRRRGCTSCPSSCAASSARKGSPRARSCCTSRRSWSASRSATTPSASGCACYAGIEALRAEVDEMLAADYLNASRRAPRRPERLPDVRQRQGLGPAHGGLDRQRPRRRGRGREGAVGHPRPHVARRPTPTSASGCTTSTTSPTACSGSSPATSATARELPEDAILVARNIGPGELLDYGRKLRGVVLEEGSVGSHAAIVARALAIPLVIQAARITREALNGDAILRRRRPGASCTCAPRTASPRRSARRWTCCTRRRRPTPRCATSPRPPATASRLSLYMNAGLMADLPSLPKCGALGRRALPHRAAVPDPHHRAEARRARRALCPHPRLAPATSRWSSAPSTSARTRCCPT